MQKTQFTKQRKVLNHLASGKAITSTQARAKFGIKNLRACISSIRNSVERFGNWEITTDDGTYRMYDTHPGTRSYKFGRDGSRTMIS